MADVSEDAVSEAPAFVKARLFLGARAGYVFKTGEEGLGYYLEDAERATRRLREAREGPDIPSAPIERGPLAATPAEVPVAAKTAPKPAWNPFDELPPPKKSKTQPLEARERHEEAQPVKVFAPSLFQLEKIRCLHIVIKHAESRNPKSWRNPKVLVTRTVDAAAAELTALRRTIEAAPVKRTAFEDAARQRSDCNSAKKGGDLGWFKRKQMTPAFEEAAFNLELNELSGVVRTSSGVHLILRIG